MKGYLFRVAVLSLAIALGFAVSHPSGDRSDIASRVATTSAGIVS